MTEIMKKTVVSLNNGKSVVSNLTPNEVSSVLQDRLAMKNSTSNPSELDIRLAALEAKVGITSQDKNAARIDLTSKGE